MLFRGSRKVVDRGLPDCPVCHERMTCDAVESEGEEEDAYAEAA
jgi:hypothetical protein